MFTEKSVTTHHVTRVRGTADLPSIDTSARKYLRWFSQTRWEFDLLSMTSESGNSSVARYTGQ